MVAASCWQLEGDASGGVGKEKLVVGGIRKLAGDGGGCSSEAASVRFEWRARGASGRGSCAHAAHVSSDQDCAMRHQARMR